jgi:hypothetical protein
MFVAVYTKNCDTQPFITVWWPYLSGPQQDVLLHEPFIFCLLVVEYLLKVSDYGGLRLLACTPVSV